MEVWNKIDLMEQVARAAAMNAAARRALSVATSAATGEGLDQLLTVIEAGVAAGADLYEVRIDATAGDDLAWLYRRGEVLERLDDPDGAVRLKVRMPLERVEQAASRFGARWQRFVPGRAAGEQAAE